MGASILVRGFDRTQKRIGNEPEDRASGSSLKQSQSYKLGLRNVVEMLWLMAFSCSWLVGMYIKARRPMHLMPSLGLIMRVLMLWDIRLRHLRRLVCYETRIRTCWPRHALR